MSSILPTSTAHVLRTALAVFSIAVMLSACQAQPSSPESQVIPEIQTSQSPGPAVPNEQTGEATSPELSEQPDGSSVVSTTATYQSPAGPEEVGFSLVVDSQGNILSGTTTVLAKSPISKTRQNSFSENFSAAVTGKKLADLGPIDRVGGSSLTTGAFNKALSELQNQL